MKNLIPFLLLGVLVSCQKTDELTYTEKRLIGSWFLTNVDYTPRWSFRTDITGDYFGQIMTFNEDFSFQFENTATGIVSQGVWEVNQVNAFNAGNNSNQWTDQLVISYTDTTNTIIQQVWDNFCISKNLLNADNTVKDGHFQYQLKRLQ
ncbi:MAG: hypothetical protein IPO32_03370 [Crocinitomicaceae bacterium]|nr:hypothetical protein [Crocinitomicaceae bacterium]